MGLVELVLGTPLDHVVGAFLHPQGDVAACACRWGLSCWLRWGTRAGGEERDATDACQCGEEPAARESALRHGCHSPPGMPAIIDMRWTHCQTQFSGDSRWVPDKLSIREWTLLRG